jgi:hypothetical protein
MFEGNDLKSQTSNLKLLIASKITSKNFLTGNKPALVSANVAI